MFENLFKKYNQIVFFDTETTGFNAETTLQIRSYCGKALYEQ